MNLTNSKLAQALISGRDRKIGPCTVSSGRLIYHKSIIATCENGVLRISLYGHGTRTTTDKLNAVLETAKTGAKITRYGEVTLPNGTTTYWGRDKWLAFALPEEKPPTLVTQSVEYPDSNPEVAGSIPVEGSNLLET